MEKMTEQVQRFTSGAEIDLDRELNVLFQLVEVETNLVMFSAGNVLGYHFGTRGRALFEDAGDSGSILRAMIARLHTLLVSSKVPLLGGLYGFECRFEKTESFSVLIVAYNQPPFPQLWMRRMDLLVAG